MNAIRCCDADCKNQVDERSLHQRMLDERLCACGHEYRSHATSCSPSYCMVRGCTCVEISA